MNKWYKLRLGDLVKTKAIEIKTGPFGSQLHQSDYVKDGVPVVMPKDIKDWSISNLSIARTSEAMSNKLEAHRL